MRGGIDDDYPPGFGDHRFGFAPPDSGGAPCPHGCEATAVVLGFVRPAPSPRQRSRPAALHDACREHFGLGLSGTDARTFCSL